MRRIFLFTALLCCVAISWMGCRKDIVTGTDSPVVAIQDVQNLYQGSDVILTKENLMGASAIVGVVISDPDGGNAPDGLVIIQNFRRQKLRGIALALGANAAQYKLGDSLFVKIEGGVLGRSNGTLQISGISASAITKVSANNKQRISLVASTFTSLTDNIDIYEKTLVQLKSAVLDVPVAGATFQGDKIISDWANPITFHTNTTANFAATVIPDVGDYTGIPILNQEKKPVFYMRNSSDIVAQQVEPHIPGALYANFAEGWEHPIITKTSNVDGVAVLPTGEWQMNGMYLISSANIKVSKHGTWTVMMQKAKDCLLQMNFNLPYGASKFSFYYGAPVPTSDGATTLRAEYSQDAGTTWTALGPDLQVTDVNRFYFQEYTLNIKGPVRFRIHKLIEGPGVVDMGRLSVDDIAVYQN